MATSFSINSDGVKSRWVVPLAHGEFKASEHSGNYCIPT